MTKKKTTTITTDDLMNFVKKDVKTFRKHFPHANQLTNLNQEVLQLMTEVYRNEKRVIHIHEALTMIEKYLISEAIKTSKVSKALKEEGMLLPSDAMARAETISKLIEAGVFTKEEMIEAFKS
jgi:hypothetical protein